MKCEEFEAIGLGLDRESTAQSDLRPESGGEVRRDLKGIDRSSTPRQSNMPITARGARLCRSPGTTRKSNCGPFVKRHGTSVRRRAWR